MKKLPETYQNFIRRYPTVGAAYRQLGEAIHEAGPLSERERRLVKLALAVGSQQEGAVHSQVRKALDSGLDPEDLRQVVVLGMTTLGFPRTIAALTWVEDLLPPHPQPLGEEPDPETAEQAGASDLPNP